MAKTSTTPAVPAAEPDLGELLEQRAALDAQITEMQKLNRAANIAKAREFCIKHGLTADDVFPGASASPSKAKAGKRTIARPKAKYRDEKTGETWTGRGFKPVWLRNRLAAGAKLEDFLLDQPL